MDKVLVIDRDAAFLERVKEGINKLRQFELLTAADGPRAVSILGGSRISVVATDIAPPDLDVLDLLSHMSQKHPNTPCIVMSGEGKPWFENRQSQQSFIYHLEKPVEAGALVSAFFVALNLRDEGATAEGMSIPSLLPLIEMQRKTCRMQIRSGNKRVGYLYFENGEIIDAHYGKLNGEYAAREIATWNRITFMISELPRHRTRRRVKTKLMHLAGATWRSNNGGGNAAEGPTGPNAEKEIIFLDEAISGEPAEKNAGDRTPPQGNAPGGGADADAIKRKADAWLNSILQEIKHIQGYQAIAVVDDGGRVLAAKQNSEHLNLDQLAGAMGVFLASAKASLGRTDFESAEALTLHTRTGIVVMQQLEAPLCALVACPPRGNWFFFKSRLENLPYTAKGTVAK